ncbi:MAG: DUF460 domain-containing protein [Archaeoglobaceae archaeon]
MRGSVVGVDVIGGRVKRFAVVAIGEKEFERSVSRGRLLRLLKTLSPEIIAVDNIFEVFGSREEILNFLRSLPNVKLVQVAGKNGSLPSLARRFGIRVNIRNPFDEARVAAMLASFGVGYEVSVFTNKTRIVISRARSLGKGGWRQKRYGRRVHELVRQVYREICYKLSSMGFEYVEDVRSGYGGISRAVITVNAAKSEVPVSSFRTKDVQVKVEAIAKEKIELIPLSKTVRYTIVGVDPGATTGVAIIDLDGNLIDVTSRKNWSAADVIDYIASAGKPVIVATDKSSPPELVQKIRAAFNAVLHAPKEDLSVGKKKSLTARYRTINDHERDALAAAIDAYNFHKNKFKNVEKRLPAGIDADRVKAEILRGVPISSLIAKEVEEEREERKREDLIPRSELEKKEKIISELRRENELLRKEISELRSEIERLREKIIQISKEEHERIRRDNYVRELEARIAELRSEIKKRDAEIAELKEKVEKLKQLRLLEMSGWREIKVLRKFTKEEVERAKIEDGDIVYIIDSSGGSRAAAEALCRRGIKAIIYGSEMSHVAAETFDEYGVPRVSREALEVIVVDDVGAVEAAKLDEALKNATKELNRRKIERLERLFEQYKRMRSV